MKKVTAILLVLLLTVSALSGLSVSADEADLGAPSGFTLENALYAHAVLSSTDTQAWQEWQSIHDEDGNVEKPLEKYFFLPTSANSESVDIYNGFESEVVVNGTAIAAGKTANVAYKADTPYTVKSGRYSFTLTLMKSNAEAAIYVNNSDADGKGTDLMTYLNADKELSAKATGAIVTPDGTVDNTKIKKIKGRGNTTWQKPKKAYNITYDSKVAIAGMTKAKKYSILADYQDDSLSRNRFLYDLSDAVGMPYASDSRYVDFYANGVYLGSYQMTEKVEVGASSLVNDFEETDYLDAEGNVKEDFPFLCEVDAGANDTDYYVSANNGIKITIKAPELSSSDKGYNEVKEYVRNKFNALYDAAKTTSNDLSPYLDIDSAAKIYLINELGKNWDAGVSSLFFTYKQDSEGNYKFFGSPVWDYDNSLGNAVGISGELKNIGVSDYEQCTGWWCRYKGKNSGSTGSNNIMNRISKNTRIIAAAKQIWFDKFVPAIDHFSGRKTSEEIGKELYTADEYYSLVKDSALMNYKSGWLLNTGDWIAKHNKLTNAFYDVENNTYNIYKTSDSYADTFEGMFGYARDWMISRAAWLSKQMSAVAPTTVYLDKPVPEPEPTTEPEKKDITACTVSGIKSKTYSGKAQTQSVTVKDGDTVLQKGTDFTVSYKNNKNAGNATVIISGTGDYTGTLAKTFKIAKANQPMTVKAAVKSAKASALRKSKVNVRSAVIVRKNQGSVTYSKVRGSSKLTVSKKGIITVKKGTYKKGTVLKVKVKAKAKGTSNYKSGSKTVTAKIKIK